MVSQFHHLSTIKQPKSRFLKANWATRTMPRQTIFNKIKTVYSHHKTQWGDIVSGEAIIFDCECMLKDLNQPGSKV